VVVIIVGLFFVRRCGCGTGDGYLCITVGAGGALVGFFLFFCIGSWSRFFASVARAIPFTRAIGGHRKGKREVI
jgi:hypothetical protein